MAESSRRTVLACAGAACAAALTGCTTYNSNSGGVNGPQGTQPAGTDSAPDVSRIRLRSRSCDRFRPREHTGLVTTDPEPRVDVLHVGRAGPSRRTSVR